MKEFKNFSKTKKKTLFDSIKKAKEMFDSKTKSNLNNENNIPKKEKINLKENKRNLKAKSKFFKIIN